MQGELSAARQTEGLVSYNNAIVTEHYNPSVSLTLNTSPYTGEVERGGIVRFPYPYTGEAERGGIVRFPYPCTGEAGRGGIIGEA